VRNTTNKKLKKKGLIHVQKPRNREKMQQTLHYITGPFIGMAKSNDKRLCNTVNVILMIKLNKLLFNLELSFIRTTECCSNNFHFLNGNTLCPVTMETRNPG
jgi:hypothetical protein